MTNEEKQNVTIGGSSTLNGCAGMSGSVSRLGYTGLCFADGPSGIRGTEMVNGYASGISVGASWNRELAYERGRAMGAEAKLKGINVLLAPSVGALGRVVTGGRNWEAFSNDPYLCGAIGAETVTGLQENVMAVAKHYIANEQETNRIPSSFGLGNASVSSNLDDKTIHELYLWPFQDLVKAGVGAVMCSYQRVNNSYSCQNSKIQNGLLKTELGFQGISMTDWDALYTGIAAANAGLDLAMGVSKSVYWDGNLTKAVNNGTLAQSRLDDMATRIVAAWYRFAQFEPGTGFPVDMLSPHQTVSGMLPSSKRTIFQGAVEGHVLVKNVNKTLPLKAPKILSLYGYDGPAPSRSYPRGGTSKYMFGYESVSVAEDFVYGFYLQKALTLPQAAYNGTLIAGGGSSSVSPAYISAPFDAFQERARRDGTWLVWDFRSQDPAYEAGSDACLVFINEFAAEGVDRAGLADAWSDTLVLNVAAKCANTIVVVHNAGVRLVDAWIEHANVTAVILAHLPGQDSGRALVELVYGEQSPSGRLPYTVARRASDYGDALLRPVRPDNATNYFPQSNFTEGVYTDYRALRARATPPRFAFGFGLTYTTFAYANLSLSLSNATSFLPPPSPVREGGEAALWDVVATVGATITNTGDVAAAEVAQLYVGIPNDEYDVPARQLRGFDKVPLAPGESAAVAFALTRRDLSVWDAGRQRWVLPRGRFGVGVGASVEDVRLEGGFVLE
ncbi:putative beta-glucosidase m [Neofusicoccum parvum]|uniref:Beta-glucosidase m n=2 Tax=Neofusicoccum parvum TaxID=310453 RepID=A0ACB5S6K4_9PEZI|nr:putative beta-glucosidase m [Neofusicoccum parvum]